METRLRKRKEQSLPTNPYARVFTKRRNFTNLRARRVFSPASVSDVKGGVEGSEKVGVVKEEETGGKVGFLDLGSGQEGRRESGEDEVVQTTPSDGESKPNVEEETEIVGKVGFLDLGECEKEEVLDLGFAIKDGGKGEEDELIQTTPLDSQIGSELKQNVKGGEKEEERVLQKDGFVGEGEREEQPKPKVKTGFHARSRSRLYKNPSSFSYKRLLPFLMDLTKDDSDAPVIYPIKKVDKFEEETLSPSLSVSQDILIDGVNKEVLPNKHPLGVLNASSNIPSNIKDSHSKSPEDSFIESTTPKTPSTTSLPTVNNLVIEKQVHLYGETASKTPEDIASVNSSCSLANLESSPMNEGDGLDKMYQRNNGNAKTETYNDESLQSTPPDSDVFCKPEPGKSKDCALDSSLKNRSVYDKNKRADESEKDNTKAKLGVLVPCSRKKLYRTPGSFSYRRLLPYLTNLAKNDTYTIGASPCQNLDKTVNVGRGSSLFDSQEVLKDKTVNVGRGSSLFDSQEVLKDGVDKGVLTNEHCFGGSDASNLESTETTSPIGASNVDLPELNSTEDWPAAVVSQDPIVKSVIQEPHVNTIVSEVGCSTITKPSHADVESVSQVQQDTLDKVDNTELAHQGTLTVHETNVSIKSSAFPVITTQSSSLIPKMVDNGSFLMLKSSTDAKSPMELSLKQESPNKLPLVLSEISPSGSSTGILKRHPRGCRGICNCLNCASYRLHAERAFEFSKNQMQDTEEVTMELVKELSDIRTLLEKSTSGAEPHSVQVPQLQAKEACMKALRAEENAKYYLKQMSEELNIHCQTPCLQRPRVRFANNFEA